jgi:hypothetical protein
MSNQKNIVLTLDSTHCKAICDEIGERFGAAFRRDTSPIPPRLMELIDRLAELDESPSIVPSLDDILLPLENEPLTVAKRSIDQTRTATNRILAVADF